MESNPVTTSLPIICRICGGSLRLEGCETDEHGLSVHRDCYAALVSSAQQALSDRILKDMIILDRVVRSLLTVIRKMETTGRTHKHRGRDLEPAEWTGAQNLRDLRNQTQR